jgi:hypothetical protein
MCLPAFGRNPIGIEFDPDELIRLFGPECRWLS